MSDLFEHAADSELARNAPLADRMRPRRLSEYVGQEHLVGEGRFLERLAAGGQLTSLILWGPPGTGKTTLARILAGSTSAAFETFSAVLSGVKELREVIARADQRRRMDARRTVLFVDEIHRWNKAQQDAFLPHVESGRLTLIGATTQNPSFEVITPLLSRCRVCVLKSLNDEEVRRVLELAVTDRERGLFAGDDPLEVDDEALDYLARLAEGDARRALNGLELSCSLRRSQDGGRIGLDTAREAMSQGSLSYGRMGDEHYNQISAFIKSLRGSDPDGALYWMVRMLEAGEDPLFILRRLVIFAAEDVGNADPRALPLAVAALQAFSTIGLPEGKIPMAQAVTYLATAPKSNASYLALGQATETVRRTGSLPVPLHLRNAPTGLMAREGYGVDYQYPHDFPGHFVREQYLPDAVKDRVFYAPTDMGEEKRIKARLQGQRNGPPLEGPAAKAAPARPSEQFEKKGKTGK
jgi:putative ATPase